MKSILKQPLLHFLLIAGLIFLLNGFIGNQNNDSDNRIYIDEGVESLVKERFISQWRRAPSDSELENLIADYIKKEVLYREALSLNLDKNDEIIKRRMQQKMYALLGDVSDVRNEITDDQIEAYYKENIEDYTAPTRYSFYQIGYKNKVDAINAGKNISNNTKNVSQRGDIELFTYYNADKTENELQSMFGGELPSVINDIALNKWSAPIQSGFGHHLIYLENKQVGAPYPLDQIKANIVDDIQFYNAKENEDKAYKEILNKYKIINKN